jgi:hypothetical protein
MCTRRPRGLEVLSIVSDRVEDIQSGTWALRASNRRRVRDTRTERWRNRQECGVKRQQGAPVGDARRGARTVH